MYKYGTQSFDNLTDALAMAECDAVDYSTCEEAVVIGMTAYSLDEDGAVLREFTVEREG